MSPRAYFPPPWIPSQPRSLIGRALSTALLAAIILLPAAVGEVPHAPFFEVPQSSRTSSSAFHSAFSSSGFGANYNYSLVSLPNFNPLSSYLHNYRTQYPTYDFAGSCAGGIIYIDNTSRVDCYNPFGGTERSISAPLTLLYQQTPGLSAQIDNELQLDTSSGVGLLYGNLTTSPGDVTVETVDLTNGSIRMATTPVVMGNTLQADYVGGGIVVVFNGTGSGGSPTYLVNMYNGTSWPSGVSIGFAPNNVYWVSQLGAFVDVQGLHLSEWKFKGVSIVKAGDAWFNDSYISSVSAVDGVAYSTSNGKVALQLSTNLGNEEVVANTASGTMTQSGSYSYFTSLSYSIQRYSYSSTYQWATTPLVATELVDPFNNATLTAPNLVGRQESSGANGNFELTDPYSTSFYISLNPALVNASTLGPNQFVFAWEPVVPSISGGGDSITGLVTFLGIPLWIWFAAVVVIVAVPVAISVRKLKT
jgi:hypothetical protein